MLKQRDTLLFLLYGAIYHIGLFGITDVILNFYFVSLGYDTTTISALQSIPRLAGFVTSVPISLLANRIGSRRMLALANVGVVIALLLPILVPVLPAVAISRFLLGFSYGAQQIASAPLMMMLVTKAQRTRFFAYHNVITVAAGAGGSFVGGHIPAWIDPLQPQSAYAYGVTLLIAVIITVISVIPFALIRADAAPPVAKLSLSAAERRRTWGFLAFLASPMLVFGFTGGLTFPFYNLFFRHQFALPDDAVGTIIGIGWLGMAFIPMLNPLWEQYLGRARALAITMVISACGFFALGVTGALPLAVIAFVVGIGFRNVMQPLYQPLVLDSLPRELHNNSSGVSMVLWNIGWFTATAISGTLQLTVGYGAIMIIVALGVLLTAVIIMAIFHKPRFISSTVSVKDSAAP